MSDSDEYRYEEDDETYDFSLLESELLKPADEPVIKLSYEKNSYKSMGFLDFDEKTTERYRILRITKTDPITMEDCDESYPDSVKIHFEYKYMWNPYNGTVLRDDKGNKIIDPYGGLHFNAENLLYYFYINRLNGLWIEGTDGYEGTYGEYLGCGENIEILNRGDYPEKNTFRLPIANCYLKKDHLPGTITYGPLLDIIDLTAIHRLCSYRRCTIFNIYDLYNEALSKTPTDGKLYLDEFHGNIIEANNKANRIAVNKLKTLLF
jgi:hypothetical protein